FGPAGASVVWLRGARRHLDRGSLPRRQGARTRRAARDLSRRRAAAVAAARRLVTPPALRSSAPLRGVRRAASLRAQAPAYRGARADRAAGMGRGGMRGPRGPARRRANRGPQRLRAAQGGPRSSGAQSREPARAPRAPRASRAHGGPPAFQDPRGRDARTPGPNAAGRPRRAGLDSGMHAQGDRAVGRGGPGGRGPSSRDSRRRPAHARALTAPEDPGHRRPPYRGASSVADGGGAAPRARARIAPAQSADHHDRARGASRYGRAGLARGGTPLP